MKISNITFIKPIFNMKIKNKFSYDNKNNLEIFNLILQYFACLNFKFKIYYMLKNVNSIFQKK